MQERNYFKLEWQVVACRLASQRWGLISPGAGCRLALGRDGHRVSTGGKVATQRGTLDWIGYLSQGMGWWEGGRSSSTTEDGWRPGQSKIAVQSHADFAVRVVWVTVGTLPALRCSSRGAPYPPYWRCGAGTCILDITYYTQLVGVASRIGGWPCLAACARTTAEMGMRPRRKPIPPGAQLRGEEGSDLRAGGEIKHLKSIRPPQHFLFPPLLPIIALSIASISHALLQSFSHPTHSFLQY